jgi:BirA family biotin operon repressor/biotin-[acetyl-CoA-carboxylase] ligase
MGLLLSVLLRPDMDVSERSLLTVMAAVAVARAVQETYRQPALIRWPNDITIRGRKAGGILVEARTLERGPAFVVGIGLNTGQQTRDFPPELRGTATSLTLETGRPTDRIEFARAVLRSLDAWYRALRRQEYGLIAGDWRHLSSTIGRRVVLSDGVQEHCGRVLDLTLSDGLILRFDSGVTRVFPSAQVTLKQEGDAAM